MLWNVKFQASKPLIAFLYQPLKNRTPILNILDAFLFLC
ncbi:hypothetical protein hp908_1287 [Helicobacter pylori 908]|nr:hypothetical protein hp908_1287 [Helicobacter pylori 908]ADZ50360.1 hypothetical protein hp2017_1246 [Helicobacter pylori 2017]ADZ51968.1 hypothetical protein hp2018_1251 [Helicobacter pylori 2018]